MDLAHEQRETSADTVPSNPESTGEHPDAVTSQGGRVTTSRRFSYACRVIVVAAILIALGHNLWFTWQRWGDIIYDSGRELDTPKQLLAGKTLYKDVRYWYGPLAPYTNALLYRLFGVKLSTLTTAGIVSAALLAWLVYRTVRLFARRSGAAAAAIAFLYICAFPEFYAYNHLNFALPYSYPATYGILIATASVYFLLRHMRRGRPSDFLLSCLFLSLAALCKVEVVVAAGVAHAVFLVGWLAARRLNRLFYLLGYAGAVVLPVCVYGCFYARVGSALWSDNLFLPGNVAASGYTLEHLGLSEPIQSLKDLALSAAVMAVCLVSVWAATTAERRVRRDSTYDTSMRAMAVGVIVIAAGMLCGGSCYLLGPFKVFRALPVLLIISFIVFMIRWLVRSDARAAQVPWMVLCAFGLAAASRMILKCGAEHYGFYLLVPGLIGFAVLWCQLVPVALAGREGAAVGMADSEAGHGNGAAPAAPRARSRMLAPYVCGIVMLAGTAWSHASLTQRTMQLVFGSDDLLRIATPQGTMVCPAMYKGTIDKLVEFLRAEPAGTKVVVMPEGSGITFLAGCTNPLGVHTFLPIDFSGAYTDSAMVERLTEASPDFIILVPRNVEEYGKKAFGNDYGKPVFEWMQANYRPAKQFRTRTYQLFVFGKRGAGPVASSPSH
jgi:hypothetical protein